MKETPDSAVISPKRLVADVLPKATKSCPVVPLTDPDP